MRVECSVDFIEIEDEKGRSVEGVKVTCGKCDATQESFGTGDSSVKRCFALLRENCDEKHFYVRDDE